MDVDDYLDTKCSMDKRLTHRSLLIACLLSTTSTTLADCEPTRLRERVEGFTDKGKATIDQLDFRPAAEAYASSSTKSASRDGRSKLGFAYPWPAPPDAPGKGLSMKDRLRPLHNHRGYQLSHERPDRGLTAFPSQSLVAPAFPSATSLLGIFIPPISLQFHAAANTPKIFATEPLSQWRAQQFKVAIGYKS